MKNLRPILLCVCLMLASIDGARAADGPLDPQSAFTRANAAFAAGDYDAAADGFRSMLGEGHVSTALLYDLGNADSKAGRTGEAILNYERALTLSPRDPDVIANLRQTRTAANLSEPERTRWEQMAASLTIDEWAWFAVACLWTACALIGGYALRADAERRPTRLLVAGVFGLTAAALMAAGLAVARLDDLDRAVLVGPGPALRVAPFESATVSTELAAGQLVEIERRHESFVLVRTAEGQAGWMPATDAKEILTQ